MADSILDDVRAAAEELSNTTADAAPEPVAAPEVADALEQPGDGRERDEAGRFKAKEPGEKRETLSLKDKPADKPAEPVTEAKPAETPAQAEPKPATQQGLSPPVNWKGNAKVQWNRLPQAVQQGIIEDHQAIESARQQFEPLTRAIEPYREAWMRDAGSIEAAIGQLGQFYQLYLTNPRGLIHHIAHTTGIDLGQPQAATPQGEALPPQAPDINSLVVQTVQQALQPIMAERQQAETQQIQQQIDAFRSDPRHPYFEDVKVHMGQLIRAGTAKDMQEAYDQAIWANPAIRQQLLEQQAEEARRTQVAAAEKARKAAAASVRGSPIPGVAVNGAGNPNASVHDDVRAAFAEHGMG